MTYRIVTKKRSIAGKGYKSYQAAYAAALSLFGEDIGAWMDLNLRIEEARA